MKSYRACLDEPINTAVFIHENVFIKNNLEHQGLTIDINYLPIYPIMDIKMICRKEFFY